MVPNKYAVCEVELENSVVNSVVCSSWLIRPKNEESQTYCFWPYKKELSCILAKYGCPPDEDFWTRHKCKILFECSDYESAAIKLKCIRESTSCDRKPNVVMTDGAKRVDDKDTQIAEALSKLNLILEKQFNIINQINNEIGEIKYQRKSLLNDNGKNYREKCDSTLYNFPLQTPDDVAKIEKVLNESPSNDLIIKIRLRQCGCKKLYSTVTTILQTIFSNECARHYTFDGNNNTKLAFNQLTICSIIIEVAMNFHNEYSESDITQQIQKWLSLTSIRIKNEEMSKKLLRNCLFWKK